MEMEMEIDKFRWTIKDSQPIHTPNYSKLDKTKEVSVESPVFHDVRGDLRVDWQLILYPGGVGLGDENDTFDYSTNLPHPQLVSIYLKMVSCSHTAVAAKFKVWLDVLRKGSSPHPQYVLDCTELAHFSTMKKCRRWGWRDACYGEGTWTSAPRGRPSNSSTLTVTCEIYFIEVTGEPLDDLRPCNPDLIDQLRSFHERGIFTDLEIVVESEVFQVHKVLLAARSPVLAAMFNHDMMETSTNQLKISDFAAGAIEKFIEFVYSGDSLDLGDQVYQLLGLADKYDVKPLKTKCQVALARDLDVENATLVLQLADLHRADILKKFALEFIKDNIKAVMTNTANWDSLPRPLVDEFIKSVFVKEFDT